MASTLVKSHKMKRSESKKSHSWLWDSHISPRNSRWLEGNLEDMDQHVKRMLKLIEEDGDSFAKKAEMYYQKRPELISLVEEFYRMYRSLAERYDHVTGELRKNVPSDLQSQGSGISEVTSEPPSICPSPDHRTSRRRSGPRAAGFDIFLGTNSEIGYREGDESSTLDSESESDDSAVINHPGIRSNDDEIWRRKIAELEIELRDVKEKLRLQQVDVSESLRLQQPCVSESSSTGYKNVNSDTPFPRVAEYEEELRDAKEKLRLSEEEINMLTKELQRYESLNSCGHAHGELDILRKRVKTNESCLEVEKEPVAGLQGSTNGSETEYRILALEEELKNTKEKLYDSEKEVTSLRLELKNSQTNIQNLGDQLGSSKGDVSIWKAKLDKAEREVSKLQDRISRYKSSLSDRDQEIRQLKVTITNANKSLSDENSKLQAEITRLQKERSYMENNLKELDLKRQSLEEDVRRVKSGKSEMEAFLGAEIVQLKTTVSERDDQVAELHKNLDAFRLTYSALIAEKDELDDKVAQLIADTSCKDDRIDELNIHLHQLHSEHVKLIAEIQGAHKLVEELRSRVEESEKEIERQQGIIQEGAEEKREAIRQLCFSLEHYRNGYHRLREAVIGHKRCPIMAS